jgi:hypothetical protein
VIKADLQTIADGYAAFAQILADANLTPGQIPSPEVAQQLADAAASLDTTDFKAAADRVSAWFANQCQ